MSMIRTLDLSGVHIGLMGPYKRAYIAALQRQVRCLNANCGAAAMHEKECSDSNLEYENFSKNLEF